MEKDYSFELETEEGKKIACELLFSFFDKEKNKNYLVFTDNSKNEEGSLNTYIYYNTPLNEELMPVIDDKEFAAVSKAFKHLESKLKDE